MSASIMTVVGARPQFIKAASVSRAVAKHPDLNEILVHTGQHFDSNMSEVFFAELSIPAPQYNLGIAGGTHGEMTGRMLEKLERIMLDRKPDVVLVYGDTNSTLAGALGASKLGIPIAHVEAGLRSFNRAMPEEINRVLADHLSDVLFCPTSHSVNNLKLEGIVDGVYQVGDVMFDATLYAIDRATELPSGLAALDLKPNRYVLATVHRADNTASPGALQHVLDFIRTTAADRQIVLPLHPRTRGAIETFGMSLEGFTVIEPVSYFEMARLIQGCALVLTDSGGLQKEAYFHRRPVITLRNETEWVETIEAGWNRLWTDEDWRPRHEISEYGAGDSAIGIVDILGRLFA